MTELCVDLVFVISQSLNDRDAISLYRTCQSWLKYGYTNFRLKSFYSYEELLKSKWIITKLETTFGKRLGIPKTVDTLRDIKPWINHRLFLDASDTFRLLPPTITTLIIQWEEKFSDNCLDFIEECLILPKTIHTLDFSYKPFEKPHLDVCLSNSNEVDYDVTIIAEGLKEIKYNGPLSLNTEVEKVKALSICFKRDFQGLNLKSLKQSDMCLFDHLKVLPNLKTLSCYIMPDDGIYMPELKKLKIKRISSWRAKIDELYPKLEIVKYHTRTPFDSIDACIARGIKVIKYEG